MSVAGNQADQICLAVIRSRSLAQFAAAMVNDSSSSFGTHPIAMIVPSPPKQRQISMPLFRGSQPFLYLFLSVSS
jgi:hypothetical protein